ncbi:MAG TPA: radical SAM protein [Candidatus Woesebacteria bacterium]|nr:radical SAM protein [Candidatus Woesebacteria bacterium]
MKIVFINPSYGKDFVRSARWAAKSRGRVQRHPENALIALSVLRESKNEVKFIEGAALNLTRKQILKEICTFNPDMAIIHTTTPSIYNDLSYAKNIKKLFPKCITVAVGAHVTAEPRDSFRIGKKYLDVIAIGEYDYTLRDLAKGKEFKDVDGIWYRAGNKVLANRGRKQLDVKELPFPAWDLIDPKWYHDAGKRFPFLTLYSGRGCFGLCTFCRETQLMNGRNLRLRDPKVIVDEMEYDLKLYPDLKEIMFETDTFTAVPSQVREVCNEIIKRGLNKKISWSCNVRVDIDIDLLKVMKEAGCRMLMVGFEFGSQKDLDAVKKGTNLEQAKTFAKEASRLGFTIHGCFMIGAPGETEETAQMTVDFAKSLPLDTVQFSGICVYPGTEMYLWAKKNNFINVRDWKEWVDKNHEQRTILSYPNFSKKMIDKYVDKGLKEFYLRPKQILRMLKMIKNPSDLLRKIYGFKKFVDYFSKNK